MTFGLFAAGYHDTPEKLHVAQIIGIVVMFVATVVALALAMRARRAQYPADRDWTYGSALGTGVLVAVWGTLFGAIIGYIYMAFVNPQLSDVIYQMQVTKLEEKGLSADKIAQAEKIMRMFLSPIVLTIGNAIQSIVLAVIFSLIVAIFFRKPLPAAPLAAEPASPPPMV